MNRDYFIFDGVNSLSFNAYLYDEGTSDSPTADYTDVSIPARHGGLLINNYRMNNVTHRYYLVITEDFEQNYSALRAFLLSRDGYCRLEDTFHPNEYYHAAFLNALEPVKAPHSDMGKVRIEFTRKPQRYLKSGEDEIVIQRNLTPGSSDFGRNVTNPTQFGCYPLFMLKGDITSHGFTIKFGADRDTTSILSAEENTESDWLWTDTFPLYIDMETMLAWVDNTDDGKRYYYGHWMRYTTHIENRSRLMLQPGVNFVRFSVPDTGHSGSITLTMKPRWYTV